MACKSASDGPPKPKGPPGPTPEYVGIEPEVGGYPLPRPPLVEAGDENIGKYGEDEDIEWDNGGMATEDEWCGRLGGGLGPRFGGIEPTLTKADAEEGGGDRDRDVCVGVI